MNDKTRYTATESICFAAAEPGMRVSLTGYIIDKGKGVLTFAPRPNITPKSETLELTVDQWIQFYGSQLHDNAAQPVFLTDAERETIISALVQYDQKTDGCPTGNLQRKLGTPVKKQAPRKFRDGDAVFVRDWFDRPPRDLHEDELTDYELRGFATVQEDEENGLVLVEVGEFCVRVHACHLDLLTPVEVMEPYTMEELRDLGSIHIKHGERIVAVINTATHPFAKKAAKQQLDELNKDYRNRNFQQ